MTIETFMNQIDEVKRIQTLRNQIGEIQKELGFDDVVAEYVLQNAPDGADDKDLIILAIKGAVGPDVTIEETDDPVGTPIIINDRKKIISALTKVSKINETVDLEVAKFPNGTAWSEAHFNHSLWPDVNATITSSLETVNTAYSFISVNTDITGWSLSNMQWEHLTSQSGDFGDAPGLPHLRFIYAEAMLTESFKMGFPPVQLTINKTTKFTFMSNVNKKTGEGDMQCRTVN